MSEVSFGPFLLDPSSTRLLRDGVEVKLRPQAFQALRTLVRHSGQTYGGIIRAGVFCGNLRRNVNSWSVA